MKKIVKNRVNKNMNYFSIFFKISCSSEGYRYLRVTRLVEQLRLSHADGSYGKALEQYAKLDLLILDDWGIDQLDRQARRDLLYQSPLKKRNLLN